MMLEVSMSVFLQSFHHQYVESVESLVSNPGTNLLIRPKGGLPTLKLRMKQESVIPWTKSYLEHCRATHTFLYGPCI